MWDKITYPFPNSNGTTIEVWKCTNNFIPHFTGIWLLIHLGKMMPKFSSHIHMGLAFERLSYKQKLVISSQNALIKYSAVPFITQSIFTKIITINIPYLARFMSASSDLCFVTVTALSCCIAPRYSGTPLYKCCSDDRKQYNNLSGVYRSPFRYFLRYKKLWISKNTS